MLDRRGPRQALDRLLRRRDPCGPALPPRAGVESRFAQSQPLTQRRDQAVVGRLLDPLQAPGVDFAWGEVVA